MISIERGAERCCVPICTTRRYLRCASTNSSPSRGLCPHGFSTYTCFPACSASNAEGVRRVAPSLADKLATRTSEGLDVVGAKLLDAITERERLGERHPSP